MLGSRKFVFNRKSSLSGAAAGLCATAITYPFDLLRTRFAAQGNVLVNKATNLILDEDDVIMSCSYEGLLFYVACRKNYLFARRVAWFLSRHSRIASSNVLLTWVGLFELNVGIEMKFNSFFVCFRTHFWRFRSTDSIL